jgi:hypothetical protein
MSVEKIGREKSETSCMKRWNLVRGACGGEVRQLAARTGKPSRLVLVDGPLARGGGDGAKFGLRGRKAGKSRSTSSLSRDSRRGRRASNPLAEEAQPMVTCKFVCTLSTFWMAGERTSWVWNWCQWSRDPLSLCDLFASVDRRILALRRVRILCLSNPAQCL